MCGLGGWADLDRACVSIDRYGDDVIAAQNVTKRYGHKVAVDDLPFAVNGRPFAEHSHPLREVGALLEARGVHPGRCARNHLLALAATAGIGAARVDEVIDMVGLSDVASQRVGAFSLGMGQRLGIASALLADPDVLLLDEPVNGLDPDGVRWIRNLLRDLADRAAGSDSTAPTPAIAEAVRGIESERHFVCEQAAAGCASRKDSAQFDRIHRDVLTA